MISTQCRSCSISTYRPASSTPICRSSREASLPPGTHDGTFPTTLTTLPWLTPPALTWKSCATRQKQVSCAGQLAPARTARPAGHLHTCQNDPTTCPSHPMSQRPCAGSHTTEHELRSSPLFAPRPLGTWVSRQTACEAVKSNGRRAVTPASCRGAACLMERLSFWERGFPVGGPCFQSFSNSGTKGPP